MDKYRVIGRSVNVASGILELSEDQAASRNHSLTSLGEGLYQVDGPVQFKRGEEFGYDGDVNKALMAELEDIDGSDKSERELLIEEIERAESLEDLDALMSENEKRKTVKIAYTKRLGELEQEALIKKIVDVETVEELNTMISDEETREAVLEAIESKQKALQPQG